MARLGTAREFFSCQLRELLLRAKAREEDEARPPTTPESNEAG